MKRRYGTHQYTRLLDEDEQDDAVNEGELPGGNIFNRNTFRFPKLSREELQFHNLVEGGNIDEVRQFLATNSNFNVNCADYTGKTPLRVAIRRDDMDMVRLLLRQPNVETRDGLLYAIKVGNTRVLAELLDTLSSKSLLKSFAPSSGPGDDVTPLVLAAKLGRIAAVSVLLQRGHTILPPHKPTCFCATHCLPWRKGGLTLLLNRLHVYEALCNPVYICLTSDDPILTAFTLAEELVQVSQRDTVLKRNYMELAASTRIFAADLVGECRNSEEVKTILLETNGYDASGDAVPFPRLLLAMSLHQKEFVSHPNVQQNFYWGRPGKFVAFPTRGADEATDDFVQVIEAMWTGDWLEWGRYSKARCALYMVPLRVILLPYVVFLLVFKPRSKKAQHHALPVNMMINEFASYLIFLSFVFLQSTQSKVGQTKPVKFTAYEYILIVYIVSYTCHFIRFCYVHTEYFKRKWTWFKITKYSVFWLYFMFRAVSLFTVKSNGEEDLERKYWAQYDPQLIAEGLFAISTILSFMQLLQVFHIDYDIGPFQISLGKMCNDCAKFSTMISVIMIAFTVGLSNFYSYYTDMTQTNPGDGTLTKQGDSWTDMLTTFKILFWGLFGMGDYSVGDVIIENLPDENGQLTVVNEHNFTEFVGYIAFGVYMMLSVIVILNMLIAAMSNTFQEVTENVHTEWLFSRTEVYLQYTNQTALPNPFNLIPTRYGTWFSFTQHKIKGTKAGLTNVPEKPFKEVMSELTQRYLKRR